MDASNQYLIQHLFEDNEDDQKCCECPKDFKPLIGFIYLSTLVLFLTFTLYYYCAFVSIISLTISLLLYEWLSLFSKKGFELYVSILYNFSEFGLFFSLLLLCLFVIKIYIDISIYMITCMKIILNIINGKFKKTYGSENENKIAVRIYVVITIIFSILFIGGLVSLLLWVFIKKTYARFIISFIIEVFFLLNYFCNITFFIKWKKTLYTMYLSQKNNAVSSDLLDMNNSSVSEQNLNNNQQLLPDNSDDINTNLTEIIDTNSKNVTILNFLVVFSLEGMYDDSMRDKCCSKRKGCLRSLVTLIILTIQFLYIFISFGYGYISLKQFIVFLVVKIFVFYRLASYNLIFAFVFKRNLKSLRVLYVKVCYYVLLFAYILLFVFYELIIHYSDKLFIPTIKSANYIETNKKWYKINQKQTIDSEGFCFAQSTLDGSLQTDDFAILATLPRLYGVLDDEDKCFIKPSMRGLFNTTMKYIFGRNYAKDGIRILCKKMTHYPILVITSEKILNKTLSHFSKENNITYVEDQFKNITNSDYFKNFNSTSLPKEGTILYNDYKKCVRINGTKNCENKWNIFEQYYWPNMFSDDFADIPGFERYQINIDSDMSIQPSFITNDKELWAGTHYIVGGSYEDHWGIGLFLENYGRSQSPSIFNNILIFYTWAKNILRETFLRLNHFNSIMFYFDVMSTKEIKVILDLYSRFNFSHKSLYTIGHSITGTTFKVASYYSDIQGIVFEAADGENNLEFLNNFDFKKVPSGKIVNIYSKSGFFTDYDNNCDTNGRLPQRYRFPNVYDTACLTAISCSETEKYVPFCKQVLSQKGGDGEKQFNISFNAFLKYYGY